VGKLLPYLLTLERFARDNHSSLLQKFVTFGRKKFHNIGPRSKLTWRAGGLPPSSGAQPKSKPAWAVATPRTMRGKRRLLWLGPGWFQAELSYVHDELQRGLSIIVFELTSFSFWNSLLTEPGNTKGGTITVPLTSCFTGLESAVWQMTIYVLICKTDLSKPVKQEVNGTVILPPLVFPDWTLKTLPSWPYKLAWRQNKDRTKKFLDGWVILSIG
jgi:hypothetical protein